MTALEFLGGERQATGRWRFALGRELHGAFGGAFGGVVAAAALTAARDVAPDRVPAALDCRFVRALRAGAAHAVATVRHEGRSLAAVDVAVTDADDRLATTATVTMVTPGAVRPLDHQGMGSARRFGPYDSGQPWRNPPGLEAPIIDTLAPRSVANDDAGIATAVLVPWEEPGRGAEAVCLPADLCVGPPVAMAFPGQWIPHPNPDLSLRFVGEPALPELIGVGRLERVAAGIAAVSIEVRDRDGLVAVGVSSSLLLA